MHIRPYSSFLVPSLAAAALCTYAAAQDGWTIDTVLASSSTTNAVAADGDVVLATRFRLGEEAAIEVRRFNSATGRYEPSATLRDPAWLGESWQGTGADVDGPVAAVQSRSPFAVVATLELLVDLGTTWGRSSLALPGESQARVGRVVAVDGRRVLAACARDSDPLVLHIVEPDAAGELLERTAMPAGPGAKRYGPRIRRH